MEKYPMKFICFIALLGLAFRAGEVSAQVTRADYLRGEAQARCAEKVYSSAVRPHWLGNTHCFWYENREREGVFFCLIDAETGEKFRAESREELARRLPKRLREAASLLVNGADRAKTEPEKAEPGLSPDGRRIAYIRDDNVYVRPAGTDPNGPEAVRLTTDGTPGDGYGPDLQWSPDSKKLATLKIRKAETRRIPLVESSPAYRKQPVLQWRDYAKPGDVLDVRLPVLLDVESGKEIPLNTDPYRHQYWLYLTGWRADSRAFTFEYNERGHQRYVVAEADAATGAIRHLADERSATFIHYGRNFRYDLNDGRQMIWSSERDGWRHLYLLDGRTGEPLRQITRGEWVVRQVDRVDEAGGCVYFFASGFNPDEDPYNLHYCRIGLDGSGFTDLTPENGNHRVSFSADRAYFTDVCSRPDLPPVSRVRRTSDGAVMAVAERCDIGDLTASGWQMPEVFHAPGRDGRTEIWGNIYRPSNFDPSKKYPVIEKIYAGPHDAHVDKDFLPAHHLHTALAELGFIVVTIDGMGTANRSKAFHDVCWRNLKDAGFPDRIAWIRAAAEKYPYMDTARVGIYGWSAGGQNALAALLFHNDFYKAAVSFCGCHDNRMDKIWWNEQWMGYPVGEAYAASSNVDNAWRLKGKLLLVNGELDDNVDPASTLQVVDALVRANKNFEQLYLPGKGHGLGGAFEMHRMYDFFVRHLLGQEPPAWE